MSRRRAAVSAGLTLVVALSSCGGGDSNRVEHRETADAVKQAAQRSLEQGTARQILHTRTEPAGRIDFTFNGVVDLLNDRERGTLVYRSFEDVEPGTKAAMITVDKVDYVRVSGQRRWLRLKAAPEDALNNFSDTSTSLSYIGDVLVDGRPDGEEAVRGAPARRYQGQMDLRKAARLAPPEARPAYEQLVSTYRDPTIPVTVWVAKSDGTIRRMRWTLDFAGTKPPAPGENGMTVVAELYDFGAAAEITAPPPALTVDE